MTTIEIILAIILGLQAPLDGEPAQERLARLQTVATAIVDVSEASACTGNFSTPECKPEWTRSPLELSVLLATKGYAESLFAKNVHEGKCKKTQCDPYSSGGKIYHKARTSWQIQKSGMVSDKEWKTMVGTDYRSTFTAATVAARILSRGYRSCKTVLGSMSFYAGVHSCEYSGVVKRHAMYQKLLKKAKKLQETPKDDPKS
jgi:hypothetical protein